MSRGKADLTGEVRHCPECGREAKELVKALWKCLKCGIYLLTGDETIYEGRKEKGYYNKKKEGSKGEIRVVFLTVSGCLSALRFVLLP